MCCDRILLLDPGPGGDDFMLCSPCDCTMCSFCAFQLVVDRKFKSPSCGKCNRAMAGVYCYRSDRQLTDECGYIAVTKHYPDFTKDPVRYYMSLFDQQADSEKKIEGVDPENKCILSLAYPSYLEGKIAKPASISVALDSDVGPETIEDENNLRKVFALLHGPIFGVHRELFKSKVFGRMSAAEYVDYARNTDESLLLKLLWAFSTGEIDVVLTDLQFGKSKYNSEYFSRFLAVSVAKEMLGRVCLDKPSPFQIMMADLLQLTNASTETKLFLSKIRVAASVSTMERLSVKNQLATIKKKIDMGNLDAFSIHLDNVGFTGRKKKWSQHTIIQVQFIPEKQLRELGFYRGLLSRDRKTFEDLAEEEGIDLEVLEDEIGDESQFKQMCALASRVVGTSKKDYQILSCHVLTSIKTAMELSLPSIQECQELKNSIRFEWETKIPLNLGNKLPTSSRKASMNKPAATEIAVNDAIPDDLYDDEESLADDTKNSRVKTFYETNNITLDKVLHEDPGSTKGVTMVADYLEEASKFSEQYDIVTTSGELPVRDIFAPATSDGSPLNRFLDIEAKDIRENGDADRRYKKAKFFMGGMHYMMEFGSMRGRLVQDVFGWFGSRWRSTEPQLNWLLCVKDPTDFVLEMPQYLLAHYRGAYNCLKMKLGSDNEATITPVDVHNHMIDRAVEHPICMAVLLDLRLVEIALLIRDSEKSGERGDINLFITTMKFALTLFVVTHATHYAKICCEFLEWWELSSEADKKFFTTYLFTKMSPNGKPIWVDRGVEWTIRHVRMFLGRYARPNHADKMDKIVPEIEFRVGAKRDLRTVLGWHNNMDIYSSIDWNAQVVKLSKVYVETYLGIMETNLWGEGPLESDFADEADSNDNAFVVGGKPISNSFLNAMDIGDHRKVDYYTEWNIRWRNSAKRGEDVVSLKLLPTSALKREEDIDKMRIVRLSVDEDEIEPLVQEFPKKKILRDLDHLREDLYPEIPIFNSQAKRKVLVRALCKWRQKYFEDNPDIYEECIERLTQLETTDSTSTVEMRREQIKHPTYSLDEDVKSEHEVAYLLEKQAALS